jgi:hypothetical protein
MSIGADDRVRRAFAVRKATSAAFAVFLGINAAQLSASNAVAQAREAHQQAGSQQDAATLTQLAQLTVQKGFKDISLGDVCDRLHIGTYCKAYQLNAAIDPAESQKYGLPAGWQTSLNVIVQKGGSNVVITDHDNRVGYAYLIGADEGLREVIVGLSTSGDGRTWRWRPGPINDDTTRKFGAEKAYWLAQIKAIQALPDRKD